MSRSIASLVSGLFVFVAVGCVEEEPPFPSDAELEQLQGMVRLRTPPASPTNAKANEPRAAALGQRLFHDTQLSGCGTISCASCHPAPAYATADSGSEGCGGVTGRNAPSALNAGFRRWLFWDGRKDSVWSQAIGPLLSPVEMAGDAARLRARLTSQYAADYAELFGKLPADETDDNALLANFGKVIEAYERTLIKVDSPFDEQLSELLQLARSGDASGHPAYLGLKTFVRTGHCAVCHKGPMLTDESFHNIGLKDAARDPGRSAGIDQVLGDVFNGVGAFSDSVSDGRLKLSALESASRDGTLGAFKTPTLRNVALTGPYMHGGTLHTLQEVIDFYNRGGDPDGSFAGQRTETIVPLELTAQQKQALIDLLQSMTGRETP